MTVDRRSIGEVHHRNEVDLRARVQAVVCAHEAVFTSRRERRKERAVCVVCGDRYPCLTVRILGGDE